MLIDKIPPPHVVNRALAEIKKAHKPNQELVEIVAESKYVEEYIRLCLSFPVRQLIWGAIALGWDLKRRCDEIQLGQMVTGSKPS